MAGFASFGLAPELLQEITKAGLTTPTLVQKQTIPEIVKGSNVIAQGKSGSGKTEAYGLGLLQCLLTANTRSTPQALVLVPTHELAVQVTDTLCHLSASFHLPCHLSIGGTPLKADIKGINSGPAIVVGTLGRLSHLLSLEDGLDCSGVKIVVLDEADVLLGKDYRREVRLLTEHVPVDCQLLLFSTTMPAKMYEYAKKFVSDRSNRFTHTVALSKKNLVTDSVTHYYLNTSNKRTKVAALCAIFPLIGERKALIFCNLRKSAEEAVRALKAKGHSVAHIHSEMPETRRQQIVKSFRKSPTSSLIATDVLSLGFDLSTISVVVNCNTPSEEDYVRRVGRCGRGGKGVAITILKKKEAKMVGRLERQYGVKMAEFVNSF